MELANYYLDHYRLWACCQLAPTSLVLQRALDSCASSRACCTSRAGPGAILLRNAVSLLWRGQAMQETTLCVMGELCASTPKQEVLDHLQ